MKTIVLVFALFLLAGCSRYEAELKALDAAAQVEVDVAINGVIDRFCSMPMDVLSRQIDQRGYDFRAGFRLLCGTRNINIWAPRPEVESGLEPE